MAELSAAADVPIVLICASAGFGKSTLAAQWSARCERPVVWVNLDRGDNDPVVLLGYLANALDRVDPVAPELLEELSARAPRIDEVVVPALAAELVRLSPIGLILDDAHELSEPRSLDVLAYLLEEIPPGSQVVLVTRADPEVPLDRIAGDLLEIRADKLEFDAGEIRALAEHSGVVLSDASLELLGTRTEGWPAAVALALRALEKSGSAEALAESINREERHLADFLFEAVLARETDEHRSFLLATSVLREMTASLCDAVTGTTGSDDLLRELERSNSFVIALDDHRGWYRYHQLFAELLRSELDRRDPALARVYLARAAEWHERDGGDPGEAFRYAHECGDLERAGRIALASWDGFANHGQLETMRLWVAGCSDDELASDPQLAITAAWTYFLLGEAEKSHRFVLAAEGGALDRPSADGATSLRSSLAQLRASLAPNGIHQMLEDAEFVYAAEREAMTRWLPRGCRAIGTANVLLGRPHEAIAALREALALTEDPDLAHVRIACLACAVFAAADLEAWPDARRWAQEVQFLTAEHRLDGTVFAVVAHTAKATVLAHDMAFDRARLELAEVRRLAQLMGSVRWLSADIELRCGNISLTLGDRPGARAAADGARAVLHGYPDPATLASRLDRLDERLEHAAEHELTPAELRILAFLPTHLSLKEIASRLDLSRATVKTHFAHVYNKLGVSSRSGAVEKMEQLGLTETEHPPTASNG